MSEIAIQVEGLSKRYRIGQGAQPQYKTLRDLLASALLAPFRRLGLGDHNTSPYGNNPTTDKYKHIWALKDVSFSVKPGEVVGIIGPNGAGKSTLLKILTRITEPTKGSIDLYGRVGSLLEVGTGFHKELTGRENVYLNGAILGMKRAEINGKFDEIVAFSGVEKFIDTPVKYYSSGMQVRLAFAVAAHLDPEILLVDEVLAVGDASFQRKCLNKMEDVGREGRTVIFVSHHMPSITRLCERVILIDGGQILKDGSAHQVVGEYLRVGLGTTPQREWDDLTSAPGNDIVRLRSVRVKAKQGEVANTIDIRHQVGIELGFEVLKAGYVMCPGFTIHNDEGSWLFTSLDTDPTWRRSPRPAGRFLSTGWIPGNLLAEGTMIVGVSIWSEQPQNLHFYERDVVAFEVVESPDGDSARGDYTMQFPGLVRPLLEWDTKYAEKKKSVPR